MPIKFQKEAPNFKYLFFVAEFAGRYTIIRISGICTMQECSKFIRDYPTSQIPLIKPHTIPRVDEYFEGEITVDAKAFTPGTIGLEMPEWLTYLADEFGDKLEFVDPYTFHVASHFLEANIDNASKAALP